MGAGRSKFESKGSLAGAYAKPLPGVELPPKLDPTTRTYSATVPAGKKGGDVMRLDMHGCKISVTIPYTREDDKDGKRNIRAGDTFTFRWGEKNRVILSTLPVLPGTTVAAAKPMVYANVSEAFGDKNCQSTNTTEIGETVARLMQEAQTLLQERCTQVGCNAVLAVHTNVVTDSSGDSKLVIVTMTGTPCVLVRSDNQSMPVCATGEDAVVKPELKHLVFF